MSDESGGSERLREDLVALGWARDLQAAYEETAKADWLPARVVAQHRGMLRLAAGVRDVWGVTAGRIRHHAEGARDLPAVGDWVTFRTEEPDGPVRITAVLPRRSAFVRRKAGTEGQEQVVAANIDLVFLMMGLDGDFNPRRMERYLVAAWESGARPLALLTKVDLCDDVDVRVGEVEAIAPGVEVLALSTVDGTGLDAVRERLEPGRTVALLGSSGVGKSTLVNVLAGQELLRTREVRKRDDRGRHTTTHRELFRLPGGALVVDTPGMRELGVAGTDAGLGEAFDDVEELAASCRFRDCTHTGEPACAVREALESGELDPKRWESYLKLQRELAYRERRVDDAKAREEKRRWKRIHRQFRKDPEKGR